MQEIGFGRIEDLLLVGGEPVHDPPPLILEDHRLDRPDRKPPRPSHDDFILKEHIVRLFEAFDRVGDGVIRWIDVREGLPCRIRHSRTRRATGPNA